MPAEPEVHVDYISMDSVRTGVGASQVVPYVVALAGLGVRMSLHTFEEQDPPAEVTDQLRVAGVQWTPHEFGRAGARGGLDRLFRAARAVRGSPLVHARSDIAAGAALLGRSRRLLWDVRSLWADQRIALGMLEEGGLEHRVMQRIERWAARHADHVVTLAAAVIPELERRHRQDFRSRTTVIPTCVDLDRFPLTPLPNCADAPVMMLSGTLNTYYDVPLMLSMLRRMDALSGARLSVVSPSATPWDDDLDALGAQRTSARPAEMPGVVASADVGLSVCRLDAGPSLLAAMPTKIAEFLAMGRPVVVNAGLGDMDDIIAEHAVGVTLTDDTDKAVDQACVRLLDLLRDPATPSRARAVAESHFDVRRGAAVLRDIYVAMMQES